MSENDNLDESIISVAEGAMLVFIGLIFSNFFWFVYRIIIANSLGSSEYGLFSIAFSVFSVTMIFSKLGIPTGLTRFISRHIGKNQQAKIRGTIFSGFEINLPFSLVVGTLLFVLAPFIGKNLLNEPQTILLIQVFGLTIPLNVFLNNILEIFRAFQEIKYYSVLEDIIQPALLLVVTFVLLNLGIGVISTATAYLISILVTAVLGAYLLRSRLSIFGGESTRNYDEILKFSLPLMFLGAGQILLLHTDNFMLAWFPDTVAANIGVYNAALPTAKLVTSISGIFSIILFPLISTELGKGNEKIIGEIINLTIRWIFTLGLPITVFLIVFSNPLLRILFGSAYVEGSFVLQIIAASFLVRASFAPLEKYFLALNKTQWVLFNFIIAVTINIVLNYLLIPIYGINGAAIALSISSVFYSFLEIIEVKYLIKSNLNLKSNLYPVISGILGFIAIYLGQNSITNLSKEISIIIGGLTFLNIYGISFILLGGLKREDILILKSLYQKVERVLKSVKKSLNIFKEENNIL